MRCDGCGFEYDSISSPEVPIALVSAAEGIQEALRTTPDDALRRRPGPDVWSALEYACHVRDVLLVQRDRLYRALVEDTPSVARMHRDERAELARYGEQDPGIVAGQIGVAAQLASQAFADLDDAHWDRRLVYNWPGAQERDVKWLAAHTVHEVRHHLGDIRAGLVS